MRYSNGSALFGAGSVSNHRCGTCARLIINPRGAQGPTGACGTAFSLEEQMPIYTILALAQLGLTIGLTVAGLMQVRASVFLFGFVMALSISLIALVMLAAMRHSSVAIGNEDAARRAKAFLVDNAFVSVGQAVIAVSMAYGLMQPMAGAPYTAAYGLASCFLSAFGLMALDVLVRQFESAAATTG